MKKSPAKVNTLNRKYGQIKKAAACLLLAALTVSLLGGCGENKGNGIGDIAQTETGGQKSKGQKTSSDQEPSGKQEGGGTEAMGRYQETELELPEEIKSQSLIQFGRGKEGNLELYTVDGKTSGEVDDASRYIFQDGEWIEDKEWTGNSLMKEHGLNLFSVVYGNDGFYYLGGTDENYTYHLLKINEDGTGEEILQEVFLPEEGEDYGLVPAKIEVLEDGNLLIYGYREVDYYTPSGSHLLAMGKDFSGNTSDNRGFYEGGEFITVQGENLVHYDLQTGKITDTVGLEEIVVSRKEMKFFGDGAGGIYAAGEIGLAHLNQGGTLWEILIDGSLNHMGMRSLYLHFFLAGEDGDYYGAFTSDGWSGISIFRYAYDPDMLSVPPTSITVYSLEDESTVRQAASQFQSEHPEVKVELRTAVETGENASEEVIQSLNTELLSGKGADVLILDGLPADAYIEKGVLMDMHDLVDEMEASGALLGNIVDGFRQEDGAIYQFPARIAFPVVLGEADAVAAYSSLKSMAEYSGEKPLLAADNYENLLRETAHLHYKEFMEEGKITERDGLVQYLETVKTLGEANGSKTVFTSDSEMEEKWVSNTVLRNGMGGSSINYDAGKCASGVELLDGFKDLCIPAQVKKQNPEASMESIGNLYLPSAIAGINQSTENADLAREFIRCLLSYDVQKEDLYDGFPVNKEALNTLSGEELSGYSVGAGMADGSYEIHAGWPEVQAREDVKTMVETLTTPVLVDETVMKMIVEGSKDYFDGRENAQQAAEKILRKLSVYLAE